MADHNNNTPRDSHADALGYSAYAETLWTRIQRALNQDDPTRPLGDDPLVVGIFGEWGAGKSFLLKQIEALASDYEKGRIVVRKGTGMFDGNAGFGLTVPVYFQPWKYEHEPHLHVPFLLHVLEALKRDLAASESFATKFATKADAAGEWVKARMQSGVDVFEKLMKGAAIATAPADGGLSAAALLAAAKGLSKLLPSSSMKAADLAATYRFTDDGRTFFDLHNHLKEVTRPGSTAAKKSGVDSGKAPANENLALNFVVFVDDLDRCLPETAVATLELIKTMFNVESFAFVLALDEEIIERGIGHRYSAYVLKDKKPEMPITGFEYLEKIVHLPFRLPALTTAQAQRFLCGREALIESEDHRRWFIRLTAEQLAAARKSKETMIEGDREPKAPAVWWERTEARSHGQERTVDSDSPHLRLVLASFEAFVPRKLLRIVELWQQIVRVNAARTEASFSVPIAQQAPGLTWNRRSPEGDIDGLDTRVVFALVLLQLFQPDLYRFMRRRPEAFPALLGAFMAPDARARRAFLGHRVADVDLWRWACRHGDESDKALEGVHDLAAARVHVATKPPTKVAARADNGASAESQQAALGLYRYMAERVRLGVVERLVDHHAAQRHLFSPLRMFHELANQLPFPALEEISRLMDRYFAVLAQVEAAPMPVAAGTGETASATLKTEPESKESPSKGDANFGTPSVTRNEFAVADIPGLAAALLADDAAQRANLRDRFELREGALLREQDALALAERLRGHVSDAATMPLPRIVALGAIAPWLSWSRGGHAVVRAVVGLSPDDDKSSSAESRITALGIAVAHRNPADGPLLRAELGDLLNRFAGGDPRFDPSNPALMVARWSNHNDTAEPIPGFARIPAGNYPVDETDRKAALKAPFLIARTATTVAQFARFIELGGFVADVERRIMLPMNWEEQVRFGNRPVYGVNWFTARAYCEWLTKQLPATAVTYRVELPTEWQWQCAARLLPNGQPHSAKFPWARNDVADVGMYGNTGGSGIERVTAVGSFEPTGPGLYDMAGNVWEWMDNEWAERFDPSATRIGRTAPKHPALRGGSWLDPPEYAACSSRRRLRPDYWDFNIGFRVVLSLAKSEA